MYACKNMCKNVRGRLYIMYNKNNFMTVKKQVKKNSVSRKIRKSNKILQSK